MTQDMTEETVDHLEVFSKCFIPPKPTLFPSKQNMLKELLHELLQRPFYRLLLKEVN